jgi:hypothetical protein
MTTGRPLRIEIGPTAPARPAEEELEGWTLLIADWIRRAPRATVRRFLSDLIEEGARFAHTPEGERWRSILLESRWGHTGWLMWNMLEVDQLVAAAPPRPDPLAAVVGNLAATVRAGIDRAEGPTRHLPNAAALPPSEGAYRERNAFLLLALGILAVSERAMASVGGAAPAIAAAAPAGPERPPLAALLR